MFKETLVRTLALMLDVFVLFLGGMLLGLLAPEYFIPIVIGWFILALCLETLWGRSVGSTLGGFRFQNNLGVQGLQTAYKYLSFALSATLAMVLYVRLLPVDIVLIGTLGLGIYLTFQMGAIRLVQSVERNWEQGPTWVHGEPQLGQGLGLPPLL